MGSWRRGWDAGWQVLGSMDGRKPGPRWIKLRTFCHINAFLRTDRSDSVKAPVKIKRVRPWLLFVCDGRAKSMNIALKKTQKPWRKAADRLLIPSAAVVAAMAMSLPASADS